MLNPFPPLVIVGDKQQREGAKALTTTPSEPKKPFRWKKPVAVALALSVAVLGAVADVASLSVLPPSFTRILLVAVCFIGLLYAFVRTWHLFFEEKVRELRKEMTVAAAALTAVRSAHQRCLEAIERMSDRERPLFSETLEVTVLIGKHDDDDFIVERRTTTPKPLVTNRTMRPIVPDHLEQIASKESIEFTVHRDKGEITVIPLREQINKLKVWLVFDPAMSAPTDWEVKYHPKGLWRPLRQQGFDALRWDDRLQAINGTPSAFTSFKVVFIFPPGSEPSVKERHERGRVTNPVELDDKTWKVIWLDDQPAGRRYEWDIGQPLPGHG